MLNILFVNVTILFRKRHTYIGKRQRAPQAQLIQRRLHGKRLAMAIDILMDRWTGRPQAKRPVQKAYAVRPKMFQQARQQPNLRKANEACLHQPHSQAEPKA
ncbi:hypothetical protein X896_6272 [Burkholderia pseudomallei ABCPW 1]|nr:hypothetical protein X980_5987 [Burkholderia pseudomallei MSHR4000]KGX23805.1 hypothetical protein X896_6272 [Burkholderia pseudomallei ABCPW 1]